MLAGYGASRAGVSGDEINEGEIISLQQRGPV
jgi:hypothetical protein